MQSTHEAATKEKPKDIVVAFRLPRKIHAKLTKIATEEERTLSTIIRRILAREVQ